ncbi:unnamed protein product [Rhizophagus irregularis]|uniref:Serine-threonine/tyrosine-protein kinase catalytic domain-containing protein n=1 Tax=Rhizophagus irregularis TaxID=588596 RepID=A0A916EEN9_9GLOM|nr:unnamed protein product [Rhizophagus irregularis]
MAPEILRGKQHTLASDIYSLELNELIEECWDANPKNRPTSKEICDISLDILNNYTNQKQVEEQKNPSSNFDETINITLNLSNTIKTHSQPIYTSKILELPPYLPEPTNCPNQQEFVSSRIAQTVQSEKFNDPQSECLECIIKDR